MAIQVRRGDYGDWDASKMLAGEFAVVMSGDTETADGDAVYVSTASGTAKRLSFADEVPTEMGGAASGEGGEGGTVPAPPVGYNTAALFGDAHWWDLSGALRAVASAASVVISLVRQRASVSDGHPSVLEDTLDTLTLPAASGSLAGVMSAADKTKLDGIAEGANAYTHPSYTAHTGQPTGNQTPAFGGTFSVSQVTSDATGHVTGLTARTVKIPDAIATSSADGLMSAADKARLDGIRPLTQSELAAILV